MQDLVIADIEQRKEIGRKRYGTVLQPFNGRDTLRDAYEEAIDLVMYLRQLRYELAAADPALRTLSRTMRDEANDPDVELHELKSMVFRWAADLDRVCPEIREARQEQGDGSTRGRTGS